MAKTWPPKGPTEVLEYGHNWEPRFPVGDADTLVEHTAVVTVGSVVVDDSFIHPTKRQTITWLSGGVLDDDCELLLTCKTSAGRVIIQTIKIKIRLK